MDILSYAIGKKSGGGGDVSGTVDISSNGTHNVASYAYASVAVPNTYTAEDEGKIVKNGQLVVLNNATGVDF